MLIARFAAAVAATTWVIGAPLVSLAGVPFPSDAQYFLIGAVAALLGLALAPVILAIGGPLATRRRAFVRLSGLVVCIALILSGAMLGLAADGRLGERAPAWIPDTTFVAVLALFVWISLASYGLRGPSTMERAMFWIGLLTGASFVVPVLASMLLFFFVPGFVFTNGTVLPFLLIDVLLWVSLPAWLIAVVVGLL